MSGFKACPFCGSTDIAITRNWIGCAVLGEIDEEINFIECLYCHSMAPIRTWNNRSPMAEVAEIMSEVAQ